MKDHGREELDIDCQWEYSEKRGILKGQKAIPVLRIPTASICLMRLTNVVNLWIGYDESPSSLGDSVGEPSFIPFHRTSKHSPSFQAARSFPSRTSFNSPIRHHSLGTICRLPSAKDVSAMPICPLARSH